MKSTRKFVSIVLAVLMLMSCFAGTISVSASTGTLCSKYATNPSGVGKEKTITIDGSFSDWSEDMLIAQGAAWDVANHYKGGHENCVLDTYALFAAYDDSNLYVAWQMVNTTDTWARSGDGPLSDGGRVLDVPLILALSLDESSTSMSNKNTSGGSIWGQKMGLEFDTHVDRLLYMSGKPGLGQPSMFKAVDAQGNTNYTDGCIDFKKNGIEYKMAEGNICSSIMGLNYSEDPADVYDDGADWVDFKTFKGSSGTHDTKYDSFYEIKIPYSTLGIDKSYIQSNGIGAMLVATRGESALDCVPFDDTMLDNATGDYSSDPSTSAEKDDVDTITSSLARIGGSVTPTPTKPVATTAPATTKAPATTQAPSTTLKVNTTSNLCSSSTSEFAKGTKTVTVTYDLKSAMSLVNGQWALTYDTSVLKFDASKNPQIMPYIADGYTSTANNGTIKGNFSNVSSLYNFTTKKPFVQVTFDVLSTGSTNVNLDVQELSVGYKSNGTVNYANAVYNSAVQNITSQTGFSKSSISGTSAVSTDSPVTVPTTVAPTTTKPVTQDTLTVKATSNYFPEATQVYSKADKTVTVTYKFKSNFKLINGEFSLYYDPAVLKFDPAKNVDADGETSITPNITDGVVFNTPYAGKLNSNFTSLRLYSFTTEKDFVTVVFDVLDMGETTVDLDLKILGVAYKNGTDVVEAYPVDGSEIHDITKTAGFTTYTDTKKTVLSTGTPAPTQATTAPQPTTQKPTTPTPTTPTPTTPAGDTLKVNATSNYFPAESASVKANSGTVTVTYKLQSNMKLINGEFSLFYDPAVLKFDPAKNVDADGETSITPNITDGLVFNSPYAGKLNSNFTSLRLYSFTTEKDFVKVTFDVIGKGETTVNLEMKILGVAYKDSTGNVVEAYAVDDSQVQDITKKAGFTSFSATRKTVIDGQPASDVMYGDVTKDNKVNVNDVTLIQRYVAHDCDFDADQLKAADVNLDGKVNVNDVTIIMRYIAHDIESLPA